MPSISSIANRSNRECYNHSTRTPGSCPSEGLPIGAMVGAIFGGAVAGLLLVGLIFLLWRRRRGSKIPLGPDGLPSSYPRPPKRSLSSSSESISTTTPGVENDYRSFAPQSQPLGLDSPTTSSFLKSPATRESEGKVSPFSDNCSEKDRPGCGTPSEYGQERVGGKVDEAKASWELEQQEEGKK